MGSTRLASPAGAPVSGRSDAAHDVDHVAVAGACSAACAWTERMTVFEDKRDRPCSCRAVSDWWGTLRNDVASPVQYPSRAGRAPPKWARSGAGRGVDQRVPAAWPADWSSPGVIVAPAATGACSTPSIRPRILRHATFGAVGSVVVGRMSRPKSVSDRARPEWTWLALFWVLSSSISARPRAGENNRAGHRRVGPAMARTRS